MKRGKGRGYLHQFFAPGTRALRRASFDGRSGKSICSRLWEGASELGAIISVSYNRLPALLLF